MLNRRLLRTVAAVLLVWIAADLAALDTCVVDCEKQPAAAQAVVAGSGHDCGTPHQHALIHPDHCFCHGLSTGADSVAALTAPFLVSRAVPVVPDGHVSRLSATLDHPPQLTA